MSKTKIKRTSFKSIKSKAKAHYLAASKVEKKYPNDIKKQAIAFHEESEKIEGKKLKKDKYGFPILPRKTQKEIADAGFVTGGATVTTGLLTENPLIIGLGLGELALSKKIKKSKRK